jgi:hypothetical protein
MSTARKKTVETTATPDPNSISDVFGVGKSYNFFGRKWIARGLTIRDSIDIEKAELGSFVDLLTAADTVANRLEIYFYVLRKCDATITDDEAQAGKYKIQRDDIFNIVPVSENLENPDWTNLYLEVLKLSGFVRDEQEEGDDSGEAQGSR